MRVKATKGSGHRWVVTESYRLVKDNTFTLIYWPRSCQLKSVLLYIGTLVGATGFLTVMNERAFTIFIADAAERIRPISYQQEWYRGCFPQPSSLTIRDEGFIFFEKE